MEYIYCGGRFDFDYRQSGFEKKAAEDYRAILLKDVNRLLNLSFNSFSTKNYTNNKFSA